MTDTRETDPLSLFVVARGRHRAVRRYASAAFWVSIAAGWVWVTMTRSAYPRADEPTVYILLATAGTALVLLSTQCILAGMEAGKEKHHLWLSGLFFAIIAILILIIEQERWHWSSLCARYTNAGCMPLASAPAIGLAGCAAVAILILFAYAMLATTKKRNPAPEAKGVTVSPTDGEVVAICCSGGGMRSAAFCLGAMNRLMEIKVFDKAKYLIGTSGGGYAAAAVTTLERPSDQEPVDVPVFGKGSSELAFLRTNTSWLASSTRVSFEAVVSLLYGIFVNLVIVAATVEYVAWMSAWELRRFGAISLRTEIPPGSRDPCGAASCYHSGNVPYWTQYLWAFFGLAALGIVVQRAALSWPRLAGPSRGNWVNKWASRQWWPFINVLNWPLLVASAAGLAYVLVTGVGWTWQATQHLSIWHNLLADGWQKFFSLSALGGIVTLLGRLARPRDDVAQAGRAGVGTGVRSGGASGASAKRAKFNQWLRMRFAPTLIVVIVVLVVYGILVARTGIYLRQYSTNFASWPNPTTLERLVAAWVALWLFSSANQCSLFPFYRDRLASAFLLKTNGETTSQGVGNQAALSELASKRTGPSLILCGTANVHDHDLLPVGRGGTSFIMGAQVGLPDVKLPGGGKTASASAFESEALGVFSVADAMAISGAAVAPVAGRGNTTVRPFRVLLAAANIRTGRWVRNPYWVGVGTQPGWRKVVTSPARKIERPSILNVLKEAAGRLSVFDPYLYITDGGHYENLGLMTAFRQHATRIIVLDASGDVEDSFKTMGDIISTARMDLGIEIEDFFPERLARGTKEYARDAWISMQGHYPDLLPDADGKYPTFRIDLIKGILLEQFSWDLKNYKNLHPDFPLTSTTDQLYHEYDFEAYRQLGYSVVESVEVKAGLVELGRSPARQWRSFKNTL